MATEHGGGFGAQPAPLTRRLRELADGRAGDAGWRAGDAGWRAGDADCPVRRMPRPARVPVPLSFAQESLWLAEGRRTGRVGCAGSVIAGRIRGPLDVPALSLAFAAVADRHQVLRSRFSLADGQVRMIADEPGALELELIDLSREDSPYQAAVRQGGDASRRGFDLAGGRLALARLFLLGPDDYILMVSAHESVCDRNSMNMVVQELSAGYQAYAAGCEPELPELPAQYDDFASWQQEALGVSILASQLEYWQSKLSGAAGALDLPAAWPQPGTPPYRAGQIPIAVTGTTTARLRELAAAHGTSASTIGLAAFHALLGRYGRTADVIVGCASPGRPHPELDRLIGPFATVLPIRADIAASRSFAELIDQVRQACRDALAHQDLPLAQFAAELTPAADGAPAELAQAFFACYAPGPGLRLGDADVDPLELIPASTRFTIELHIADELTGPLTGQIVYPDDVFEDAAMRRFAGHYENFLSSASAAPGRPVPEISEASAEELHQVLIGWNEPARARTAPPGLTAPPAGTISELFEERAASSPQATALQSGSERLSYAQLDTRANRLARVLRERGAGQEKVIAVLLPRGIDLVVALLGVAKTGSAYLPIDPASPPGRIAFMLGQADALLAVTTVRLGGQIPGGTPIVPIDEAAAAPCASGKLPQVAGPDNLAYVIYTSGSTGRPKGVAIESRALLNLVCWHIGTYQIGPGDVVSQVANPTFDAAGWEIWPTLIAGACLDIIPDETVGVTERMVAHFARARTSVTFVPTPLAQLLVREPLGRLTALRLLLTGGEAFQPRRDDDPGVPVVNHYGPTENTVVATATGPLMPPWRRPPIGAPIANVRAYVLNSTLSPAGIGVPGELYLAGAGVARGYLGRPGLTANRFRPDPFAAAPGARMYCTGDVVQWREDGTLDFLGRTDAQLKIRGHRIEPGEIETALAAHPAIAQAAVSVRHNPAGDQLVAYVVVSSGPTSPRDLRAHLARQLPSYLLPTAFIEVDRLPVSASGKIDRRQLPMSWPLPTAGDAPRRELEKVVADMAQDLLGIPRIGVHDDFFELGGHSLLAMQLIARIRDATGVDLPIQAVFDGRSAARISDAIEAARTGQNRS
jgi:amino acid adenylation domain-containing protein